jgi:outer membrane protein assembly factor BamE
MRLFHYLFAFLLIVSSQACVYRMDIPQGNRIDANKMQQLEIGMTRKQVEFLLGTPAINDPYHSNEAYYIYYLYKGEQKKSEEKTMVLTYENDILVKIDGRL